MACLYHPYRHHSNCGCRRALNCAKKLHTVNTADGCSPLSPRYSQDVGRKSTAGMDWLYERMQELNISSLEQAAERCGLNRGNLYRYFNWETRPSIDVLPALCIGLESSPEEVLHALGIDIK